LANLGKVLGLGAWTMRWAENRYSARREGKAATAVTKIYTFGTIIASLVMRSLLVLGFALA